ncbi:ABC transporter permease [Actinomadura sp. 9N407]|uniref:ABC transporter permease n=1 Tax=Actinomadura sp. 9N407 TaxID=3375154 RepID=UPI0037994402
MDVLASEWLKLRSVRSTAWILSVLAAFVLLCGLWSWYIASYWDGLTPERRATIQTAPAEQPLVLALPICAAVLGALAITAEYATGMIRGSLAAVPRRPALFAAKAVLVGGVTLVTGLACMTVAVAAGRLIVGDRAVPSFGAPVSEQVPHLLAMAASAAVIALVAYGAGAALRSTAATITAVVVLLMVLPSIANLLPAPWGERATSVLLTNLADQIAAAPGSSGEMGTLSPAGAIAMLAAYAVAALAAGAVTFVRRDS